MANMWKCLINPKMLQKARGLSMIMLKLRMFTLEVGFPSGSEGKASACVAGDPASIPGSGRSPGEGNGNPLQYSFLEKPMDGGAWWATVHRVAKSQTRLSDYTLTLEICTYVSINTHSKCTYLNVLCLEKMLDKNIFKFSLGCMGLHLQ